MIIKNNINKEMDLNERKFIEREFFILKCRQESENYNEFEEKCSKIIQITSPEVFRRIYWDKPFYKRLKEFVINKYGVEQLVEYMRMIK